MFFRQDPEIVIVVAIVRLYTLSSTEIVSLVHGGWSIGQRIIVVRRWTM